MEIGKQVVRTRLALLLLGAALSGAARADVTYDSKTQITGGSLFRAVLALEPPDMGARKPVSATHVIKGNRMATISKAHATIVNLDTQTIFELDLIKKTYYSITFDQVKETLDKTMEEGLARANKSSGGDAQTFQVSSKSTDRTKTLEALSADERIITLDIAGAPSAPAPSGPQTATHILVDSWLLTVPGFDQVQDFRRRLAEKLNYSYALGLSGIGMAQSELLPAFEEMSKALTQGSGLPVESTIIMGAQGAGDLAAVADAASQKSGLVSGTLNRIGNIRRKEPVARPAAPDILVEMTTEISNFSGGFADESKFKVPDGFKQIKPPSPKPGQ